MSGSNQKPKLLVVDDDSMIRAFYDAILSSTYEIHAAESGEEALEVCQMVTPDLILLDVEMPGINGYDTCRKLREFSNAPIVFATSYQNIEEHLKAFDAGGDDILTKPLVPEILLRKVELAIKKKHTQAKLIEEKTTLQNMAMDVMTAMSEGGVLLNFVRASLTCRSYEELAKKLINSLQEFNLEGIVVLRHGGDLTYMTSHGEPSVLEISILEKSSKMGRIFQFKRNMVINYDQVSIVVPNMPEGDDEKSGRIRDNIAILAETAEAFCENVDMRKKSMERAENMQIAVFEATKVVSGIKEKQTGMLMDVRVLLQDLTDKIESTYSFLGTTNEQERTISSSMNDSVQEILNVLAVGNQLNEQFATVVTMLKGNEQPSEIDLF